MAASTTRLLSPFLWVSVGTAELCALCSRSLEAAIKLLAGLVVSVEGFQAHPLLLAEVGSSRTVVLSALRLCWLLGSLSSLPQGLSLGQFRTQQLLPAMWASRRTGKGKQDGIQESFCNLISQVTSQHLCHPLAARSESLGLAHTQGEEITQGHEYQEVEIFGDDLGGCCPACGRVRWRPSRNLGS